MIQIPRLRYIARAAAVGFLLFGVTRTHAQEQIPPLERISRVLKFGPIDGHSEPSKVDAAHALGLLGDPRAIPLLVEHLENESNNNLRLQIVRALGWIGTADAVPALEKALKDQYPFTRQQAAVALKKITGKDFDFDRSGLPDPAKLREEFEKARAERKK